MRDPVNEDGGDETIDPEETLDPDEARDPDETGPSRTVVLDTEAEVVCPACGESIVVALDTGGGAAQEYVEDCQVCCRPLRLRVTYDEEGKAEVWAEEAQ